MKYVVDPPHFSQNRPKNWTISKANYNAFHLHSQWNNKSTYMRCNILKNLATSIPHNETSRKWHRDKNWSIYQHSTCYNAVVEVRASETNNSAYKNKHYHASITIMLNLLFLKTMLKMRLTMQKMIPPTPKAYINTTAATWKTLITMIVDPSGGIPSVLSVKN